MEDRHSISKPKETNQAALAGEFSGHICFGERWYGFDDALYTAARLLELLSQTELDADALFAQYPVTFSTPEIKIYTTETRKFEVMDALVANNGFSNGRLTAIDGIRVDFDDRWGLIRPSNTSPYCLYDLRQTVQKLERARVPSAIKRSRQHAQLSLNMPS